MKPQGWLWPLSIPYQGIVQMRNHWYDLGIFKSHAVNTPVISVGNLAVGGTGKTPFVIHLTERLNRLNGSKRTKIAVISRGYRGLAKNTQVVSDGKRVIATTGFVGDEPILIAEASPKTRVVVDRKRVRGANYAIDELHADLILLDDGFQHRHLKRNLDIVLLDGQNPLGNGRVLPAGFLREPASSLARADIVVLSKAMGSDQELTERANRLCDFIKKPVVVTRIAPKYWRRVGLGELHASDLIKGKKVLAFAGIAKPESFFNTVSGLGAEMVGVIPLSDHCRYSKAKLDHIASLYLRRKAEWMVTTSKDAVKLPPILSLLPVYYLDISLEVVTGADVLDKNLKSMLKLGETMKSKTDLIK